MYICGKARLIEMCAGLWWREKLNTEVELYVVACLGVKRFTVIRGLRHVASDNYEISPLNIAVQWAYWSFQIIRSY